MAPLGLVAIRSTEGAYQRPLRIREQLVGQLFLRVETRTSEGGVEDIDHT